MGTPRSSGRAGPPVTGTFRREGDYWTIAYEGVVVRLKDAKGLRYLGYLLRHPGRRFHVVDLMAMAENGSEEAKPDERPVEPAEGEVAERARKAVTNRIRQAVERIAAAHEQLGLYFGNTIHTGSSCAYTPHRPTRWQC